MRSDYGISSISFPFICNVHVLFIDENIILYHGIHGTVLCYVEFSGHGCIVSFPLKSPRSDEFENNRSIS